MFDDTCKNKSRDIRGCVCYNPNKITFIEDFITTLRKFKKKNINFLDLTDVFYAFYTNNKLFIIEKNELL